MHSSRISGRFRTFARDSQGATAIEFAFVVGPFIFLIAGIVEVGFMLFTEYTLQNAVQEASRQIKSGDMTTATSVQFKTEICKRAVNLRDCSTKIGLYVDNAANFTALAPNVPSASSIGPGEETTFNTGVGGRAVAVIATYDWTRLRVHAAISEHRSGGAAAEWHRCLPQRGILTVMSWRGTIARLRRNQSGLAAIEMALIFPVVLVLFLGMIDVTALISDNRRLSYSANAVADLVSRLESPATKAKIEDAFKAVDVVMKSAQPTPVRVEVWNYRKNASGNAAWVWRHKSDTGSDCAVPVTTQLATLMAAGNDIIVAVTCATYTPIIFRFTGRTILRTSQSFPMREQIVMRPRFSVLLDCSDCTQP